MEPMVNPPQIDTSTLLDTHALHSTRLGRFTDAAIMGASVAVPDYVPKGGGRRMLAQTALVVVGTGARTLARRASPTPSPNYKNLTELTRDMSKDKKRNVWTFLGVSTGVALLSSWGLACGTQKLADTLRGRGVKYPFTLFGAVAATGMFALLEAEQHQNATATTKESSDD
jgi:hypothetical protein